MNEDELADDMKQELGQSTKELAATAKNAPEDLGTAMKKSAAAMTKAVAAGTALAGAIDDRIVQKGILNALNVSTNYQPTLPTNNLFTCADGCIECGCRIERHDASC